MINFRKVALCGASLLVAVQSMAMKQPLRYGVIDIQKIGAQALEELKSSRSIQWWVEAGGSLLVYGDLSVAVERNQDMEVLNLIPRPERLFVLKQGHDSQLKYFDGEVLIKGARSVVMQSRTDFMPEIVDPSNLEDLSPASLSHVVVQKFEPNSVLSKQLANEPRRTKTFAIHRPNIQPLIDDIDIDRWEDDVKYLASLNRYTLGDQVIVARDWFKKELEALPGFEVSLGEFSVGGKKAYNVVAKIKGTERPDDWYIVGGHYDSTSQSPSSKAPGAEDNASGSAGVLAIARALANHPPKASVYFIAFSGEEQGLYGSKAHVAELVSTQQQNKVKGVITMDMIGYIKNPDQLKVILETNEFAKPFVDVLKEAALTYTSLDVETSYRAWGSDHVPYLNKKIPAVLTIDGDWDQYPDYHRVTDTQQNIVKQMGHEILKMNTAALGLLAGSNDDFTNRK